jgi:REP element-mobilizing transposase RayT
MANTYSQIYIQVVFAVKGRQNLIREDFRDELEKYICGIVNEQEHKPLAIYCMPDHTHLLVGLKPANTISDLVRDIKSSSSSFIKSKKWINNFQWQSGYGAFSYSKSQIDNVIKYILSQPEHHKKTTFKAEYIAFLDKFGIDYQPEYLFEWIE